jgi:hypothetical protein
LHHSSEEVWQVSRFQHPTIGRRESRQRKSSGWNWTEIPAACMLDQLRSIPPKLNGAGWKERRL